MSALDDLKSEGALTPGSALDSITNTLVSGQIASFAGQIHARAIDDGSSFKDSHDI